jgi:hypothetical protein
MRELILCRPRSRRLRFKLVLRYSPPERLFRVFRLMWDGDWPTVPARSFSLAIRCRPTSCPLRFRLHESWGGNFG